MRSWRAFCVGVPGRVRCTRMPSSTHHFDRRVRPPAERLAKGEPLSDRMPFRQAVLMEGPLHHGLRLRIIRCAHAMAAQDITAGIVGDRERITPMTTRRRVLPLVIHAPQGVVTIAQFKGLRIGRVRPPVTSFLDQPRRLEYLAGRAIGGPGQSLAGACANRSRTFLGPKLGWRFLIATICSATSSDTACGQWSRSPRARL